MSFFSESGAPVKTIGTASVELAAKLKAGKVNTNPEAASQMLSMESLEASAKLELKKTGTSVQNEVKSSFSDCQAADGTALSLEGASIEAGTIALMGAAAGEKFHTTALNLEISNEGANVVSLSTGGAFGTVDYHMDKNLLSMEAFQNQDLTVVAAYSAGWNIGATRQDSYAEAHYPTHVLNPDQNALDMKVARTLVYNGSKRDASGDIIDWEQINILEAFRNPAILDTQSTRVVPYVADNGKNAKHFVSSSLVAISEPVIDGVKYQTAPLKFGMGHDLLDLAQNPLILDGAPNHQDQLDSQVFMSDLYLAVSDASDATIVDVVHFDTRHFVNAAFTKSVNEDFMQYQLMFNSTELAVGPTTKSVSAGTVRALADLAAAGYRVNLQVMVSGTLLLNRATMNLMAAPVEVAAVHNQDGVLFDHTVGQVKTLLDGVKFELIGFDQLSRRINSNKRTRGLLIDRNWKTDRYPVPVGSPIAVQSPLSVDYDAQALDDLINATNVRNSNMAITAQLNYLQRLKDFTEQNAGRKLTDDVLRSLEGAGRWLITPFFEEIELDLLKEVNSLNSQGRTADISAIIVNNLRDVAYRMMRDTNYQPVLQTYTQGAEQMPTLLLGTDQILPQYIQVQGDPRTLGIGMDHVVVSTPDTRLKGTITGTFSRKGRVGPDLLSWGTHLWITELVTVGQVTRNGSTFKEFQVQPRNVHIHQLPAGFRMKVINLTEALVASMAIRTKEVP